jgi:hydrogenase maturation protein HypF
MELGVLSRQLERQLNCAPSSSMGRLFDAVAALLGVRQRVSYEGQAAIELEFLASTGCPRSYPAPIIEGKPAILDPAPILCSIIDDLRAGIPRQDIAAGFHEAVANWAVSISRLARERRNLNLVGLSGGVFQNMILLKRTVDLLRRSGFQVVVHRAVPPNDGGLSLGQAALASEP